MPKRGHRFFNTSQKVSETSERFLLFSHFRGDVKSLTLDILGEVSLFDPVVGVGMRVEIPLPVSQFACARVVTVFKMGGNLPRRLLFYISKGAVDTLDCTVAFWSGGNG